MVSTDRIAGLQSSVAVKAPAAAATTANITLSGVQTIDGVAVTAGARVLVKDQTDATENGIYDVSATAWTRARDFNGPRDIVRGTLVRVISGGTTNGRTYWEVTTTDDPIVFGTSDIDFAQTDNQLLGVSSFMETVLDDTDAAAALTTLGFSTFMRMLRESESAEEVCILLGLTNLVTSDSNLFLKTSDVVGKQTIWVPAAAMTPTVSNGCAVLTGVETTAGQPDMQVLDFDASSDEHAQFSVTFPKSWNASTVTAQFFWTSTATDNDGVTWAIQGVACADGDTIDVAYGTAITVDDANQSTAEDLYVSAESSAITIAGSPGDDELCFFRVFRDVSDANDTAAEDARLIGVKLYFTTDALTDA